MADGFDKTYYVYILRCRDDSLYTGITDNLNRRMRAHCGRIKGGARYTKSHPVVSLEAAWKTSTKTAAARMEYALKKRLSRHDKLRLISEPELICSRFVPELIEFPFEPVEGVELERIFMAASEE